MALSQEPEKFEEIELRRQKRQQKRVFIFLLIIDLTLMGLVIFDIYQLFQQTFGSSSSAVMAIISHL